MYGTSITRISGLASGMDTDSLVQKLMQAESAKLNKMKQQQQKYEWQSDGYRQWNSDIFSFRSTTLFNMKLSGSYGTFTTSSSNSDAVTGTATADAIPGTYKLEVDHLAQSATMVGHTTLDETKSFADQSLTVGSITVSATDHTGKSLTSAPITIASTDKIGDVLTKLNNAKDSTGKNLGLQAIYDDTLHQFILKTKDTGASTAVTIKGNDAGGKTFLDNTLKFASASLNDGIKQTNAGVSGDYSTITTTDADNQYAAADAKIIFNGNSSSPVTSSTNTLSILGVNYTLKNVTNTSTPSTATITIARDIDTEVKNIKDFISKYNDMLDKLNKAVNEPVYRDYQPLTDDQRQAMTDKQVEQWEGKAKSGLFHNDSILKGLVNNMRNHITSTVDNGSKYNSLSAIGIESKSYSDKGKLYVDDVKLKAALQDDPDAVKNLFTQDPDKATDGQRGVISRLYDDFQDAFKSLTDKAGATGNSQDDQSVVGKQLHSLYQQIDDEQQRLTDKENQYYRQFTAMETAMSKYNSQSSWLSQQLGMGQG